MNLIAAIILLLSQDELPPQEVSFLYCEDETVQNWYQVQHGKKTYTTVACSSWEAIRQYAGVYGYESTLAASLDGVVVGNKNAPWLRDLPYIGTKIPKAPKAPKAPKPPKTKGKK